jgi:hypothetical protein
VRKLHIQAKQKDMLITKLKTAAETNAKIAYKTQQQLISNNLEGDENLLEGGDQMVAGGNQEPDIRLVTEEE